VNRAEQDVGDALGFDAAVADQGEVPHRVDARSLLAGPGHRLQPIDGRRFFFNVAAGDIHFNAGDTHGEVIRVDRRRE